MNKREYYPDEVAEKEQSPFDALFQQCEFLREVEKRLDGLADRMCGSKPPQGTEASSGKGHPINDGLIDGLARNVHALRATAEACMGSLDRIERRL